MVIIVRRYDGPIYCRYPQHISVAAAHFCGEFKSKKILNRRAGHEMSEQSKHLSREFVVKSILHILDTAAAVKGWGQVTIQIQNGEIRTIRKEGTVNDDRQVMM